MPTLTNVIVNKVYKGASGTGQYGDWQAFNFYVKGDDRKFSCFGSTLMPKEGMAIVALEYEEEESQSKKDGKWYTNNNVKTIMLADEGQQVSQNAPQTAPEPRSETISPTKRDSSLTMYISYAKDLTVALLNHKSEQVQNFTVEELANIVVQVGMNMYDKANNTPEKLPVKDQTIDEYIEEMTSDDEPPIGEEPYGT